MICSLFLGQKKNEEKKKSQDVDQTLQRTPSETKRTPSGDRGTPSTGLERCESGVGFHDGLCEQRGGDHVHEPEEAGGPDQEAGGSEREVLQTDGAMAADDLQVLRRAEGAGGRRELGWGDRTGHAGHRHLPRVHSQGAIPPAGFHLVTGHSFFFCSQLRPRLSGPSDSSFSISTPLSCSFNSASRFDASYLFISFKKSHFLSTF